MSKTQDPQAKQSAVIHCARKIRGFSQMEMAKALGVSQPHMSRLETGLAELSVSELFRFCEITHIDVFCFRSGRIDFLNPAGLENSARENGFVLDKSYQKDRASKVRSILPLLAILKQKKPKQFSGLLKSLSFDPDFFVSMDNTVSARFELDLLREVRKKVEPKQFIKLVGEQAKRPEIHGTLGAVYQKQTDIRKLYKLLVTNWKYYSADFKIELDSSTGGQIKLRSSIGAHVSSLLGEDYEEYALWKKQSTRQYLESFSQLNGGPKSKVTILNSTRKEPDFSYSIKLA